MSSDAPTESSDDKLALVEFQFVEADFIAAYQLHGAPTRRFWMFMLVLMLAIVAFEFYAMPTLISTLLGIAGVLIAVTLLMLAMKFVYIPWIGRRTFAKQPLAHLAVTLTLRPGGITSEFPRGSSTLQWKDFIRWRANNKTTLLYLSPSMFLIFPERLATLGFPMHDLKAALLRELGPQWR